MSSSRSLKIWHIAELYPPDYGGGAAVYIRDVCRFLACLGHDVRVWCTENNNNLPYSVREDTDGPVRLYRINLPYFRTMDPGGWMLGSVGWFKHQQRIIALAEQFLTNWKPDIVQFHTPFSLFEECVSVIHKYSILSVGMLHCAWLICPRLRLMQSPTDTPCPGPAPLRCIECLYSHWDGNHFSAIAKLPLRLLKLGLYPAQRLWLRTRLRQYVNGLIGYSRYMTETHQGMINGPVVHIPLGVDLSDCPVGKPYRPRNPLRFGFAGGVQTHKGFWDVLDALTILKNQGLNFELHVFGPNQESAEKYIHDCGLQFNVRLRGMFLSHNRWWAYGEIDVLIMATRDNEPYGRVIQEAAAAGVPSIAPDIAGISEQIRDGVDGLLFHFRDKKSLVDKLSLILHNPQLVSSMARNLWSVRDTREAVVDVEKFYYSILRC